MKVLLVEDDDTIALPLAKGLEREGFTVARVAGGTDALAAPEPDVVLLDLILQDLDGYEVCRRLRARSDVPIIVISARGDEVDRVVGLEIGADDYLVKPFGFRELVARIHAVTRRRLSRADDLDPVRVGPLELDRRTRRVRMDGRRSRSPPRSSTSSPSWQRTRGRCALGRRSSKRSGMPTGTGRPRPSTCTSPRCVASSATRG
jgi:DNA-binding response OmpR family regulator